ncbi:MAG: type II secretion system protein [Phycisphaerales bacterium]|nr:type II secretion system protein [Phycisphaerales bacterium]MCB9837278.1 type II secretion system protein [Phycisphaera sp.]
MTPRKPQLGRMRRGFTLMEALVAVIGVSILAVGLATIFSAISKTVTTGRRVSAINNYAAVVERVLRDDFDKMTREGFLVIRNEFALNPTGVPLSPDQLNSRRVRRIDEIMFFARGQFESARSPIDPDFVARSSAASIYYGHGQQKLEGSDGFATPFLYETNEGPFLRHGISDLDSNIGEVNPNFYAGDWTLLRKVTLLKNPQIHPDGALGPLGLGPTVANVRRFQDNELQIAGQPAAAGIFRVETITGMPFLDSGFTPGVDDQFARYNMRGEVVSPLFESGIVDVATASLVDIKQRVTQVYARQPQPALATTPLSFFAPTPDSTYNFRDRAPAVPPTGNSRVYILSPREVVNYREDRRAQNLPGNPQIPFDDQLGIDSNVTGLQSLVDMQHAWMSDALPGRSNELRFMGESSWDTNPQISFDWRGSDPRVIPGVPLANPYGRSEYENRIARTRVRYEKSPPGYNADVFGPDASTGTSAVLQAAYRADQQVIGASQFIPRCTEFIVEYSFGEIDPTSGRVIWYGHDPEGDAYRNQPRGERVGKTDWLRPTQSRPDGFTNYDPTLSSDRNSQRLIEQHLLADLINGLHTENNSRDLRLIQNQPLRYPLSHYFGYADPRAVPINEPSGIDVNGDGVIGGFDMNDDGVADDIDGDGKYTDEWPWPTLVRITMSFADPIDQSTEETFQFVIDIPSGEGI